MTSLDDLVAREFSPSVTFLNTATYGLEPASARALMARYDEERAGGTLDTMALDGVIDSCRTLIGALFGRTGEEVAISASTSQVVGTVAESLPPGSRVLLAQPDFTSVLYPFLARPDLKVDFAPLDDLSQHLGPETDLVAVSMVQSADGALADVNAIAAAARAHGARLLLDVTQAAGWLPMDNTPADFVVGAGYKWLLAPRGTAFLTGSPEALAGLRSVAANWYAADSRWDAIYGPPLRQADGARRLDLSPAWGCWAGMLPALDLLHEVGVEAIHRHDVALANRFRAGLSMPAGDSAIVSVEAGAEAVARLAAADVRSAGRAGRVRFSFHLYNTEDEVDRALDALSG